MGAGTEMAMVRDYFFVVGAPRSGTTVLQQALNRHSRIALPPETAFFTFLGLGRRAQRRHLNRINSDLDIDLPYPSHRVGTDAGARALFEELARRYLERVGRPGVTHFGEKSPEHLRRLGRIRALFPEAKIVLIYRDGRDVALSLTRLPWMSRDLYVNFALWLHYCRIQRREVQQGAAELCCVCYERLAADPEAELRRVLAFLGLPYEPAVAQGCGNREGVPEWELGWKAQALEPITAQRIGRWRAELTTEQVAVLERWGGAALRELGYELASDGRGRLPLLFFPRLWMRSLWWLLRRPGYGAAERPTSPGKPS
jgi:hypothetical protein